jgi:hypothetical protein
MQVEKHDIYGACSTHGSDEKREKKMFTEHLTGRNQLEDLDVHGRTVLKWILKI